MFSEPESRIPSRIIPSSGEPIPELGMGTWKSFDVSKGHLREPLAGILRAFSAAGGRVIDTSPMYGKAESALGELLPFMDKDRPFVATKVWTRGRAEGIRQMETSLKLMGLESADLMQVHNLVDWESHVPVLREWKAAGRIRYWGLTHYTESAYADLERVAASEKPDFLQFNYSIDAAEAETRLLPFAAANGIAVLINRPFGEGRLFQRVRGKSLPGWALEAGCHSWSAVFLKFVLAHPAVTCAIPATGNPGHLAENLDYTAGERPGAVQIPEWKRQIGKI
ncbi:MAG: aldo/keto reductase [Fibrobacteres bacterium]|nr:aldo/keto reductase [Fibrobacterota bacterium]